VEVVSPAAEVLARISRNAAGEFHAVVTEAGARTPGLQAETKLFVEKVSLTP
jgi:hypothetical protein